MYEGVLIEIIENIRESADELKQIKQKNQVEFGTMLSLCESLSIIQGALAGYDLKEFGIDFDIDKEYLLE